MCVCYRTTHDAQCINRVVCVWRFTSTITENYACLLQCLTNAGRHHHQAQTDTRIHIKYLAINENTLIGRPTFIKSNNSNDYDDERGAEEETANETGSSGANE